MGILDALEQIFIPSKRVEKKEVGLKEIICKRKDDRYIKRFNTAVVGSEYPNPDGSSRQEPIKKLKVGEKVRLLLNPSSSENKKIYVVRGKSSQQLSMPDCLGRLNDKTANEVARMVSGEEFTASARVHKITGGTQKRPKLGCVLELTTYAVTEKKA